MLSSIRTFLRPCILGITLLCNPRKSHHTVNVLIMGHDFVLTFYLYNFINNVVDIYKFHNSSPCFIQNFSGFNFRVYIFGFAQATFYMSDPICRLIYICFFSN